MKTDADGYWVGSNGNLFRDSAKFRYCIAKERDGRYFVAQDGEQLGPTLSTLEDAKTVIERAILTED